MATPKQPLLLEDFPSLKSRGEVFTTLATKC